MVQVTCEPVARLLESSISSEKRHASIEPWLSVVIPAKDESKRLPETLRLLTLELGSLRIEYEIIVVDDGSNDGGYDELAQMFDVPIGILRHERRRGIAAAFRSGAHVSRGVYTMLCPADICDFSFLAHALEICKNAEIVSVSKRHPRSVVIGYDEWRWFLSNSYHWIVATMLKIPKTCRDTHYIKIYRSSMLRTILPLCGVNGAVGETEIVYFAAKMGARMEDVPGRIVHNHNHSKTSFLRIVETILDLTRLWVRLRTISANDYLE